MSLRFFDFITNFNYNYNKYRCIRSRFPSISCAFFYGLLDDGLRVRRTQPPSAKADGLAVSAESRLGRTSLIYLEILIFVPLYFALILYILHYHLIGYIACSRCKISRGPKDVDPRAPSSTLYSFIFI